MFAKEIEPRWFKPQEEEPSEYLIRSLNGVEYQNVVCHVDQNLSGISGDLCLQILGYGLMDWKNMPGDEPFESKSIRKLDPVHLSDVALEIFRLSTFPEDRQKQRSSQSPS